MTVVGHNVLRIGLYCAVNEFVVIRVGLNQVETVVRGYQFNIFALNKSIKNIICRVLPCQPLQNLFIFCKNFIGYTQCVHARDYREPYKVIWAPWGNYLNQKFVSSTIRIYSCFLI